MKTSWPFLTPRTGTGNRARFLYENDVLLPSGGAGRSRESLEPLPLNVNSTPGDEVWCYSDPGNHPGFFSQGIVNRFYQHWHGATATEKFPRRMNVSTDWAPGSSGAAVLDRFGNAVGHVSTVSTQGEHPPSGTPAGADHASETVMVLHAAVCAADVKALIR